MVTDETIKNDIVDQLNLDSRIDASDIKVTVNNHAVTLEGNVPTYRAKTAAEDDAWLINGTYSVDNQLNVEYVTPPELPSDAEIKDRVKNTLFWNPDVPTTEIEIKVDNSWVTLTGNVESYWQKIQAEDDALETRGVVGITNELAVVPTEKISDEIIAENVIDSIKRNLNVAIDDVSVKVKNGKVILTGSVPTWNAKSAAYEAALNTIGVTSVEDKVLVTG